MNKRTIFGAVTLLLVVGVATTLAADGNPEVNYDYLVKFLRSWDYWTPERCEVMKHNLPKLSASEPTQMRPELERLLKEAEDQEPLLRDGYIGEILGLTTISEEKPCTGTFVSDFFAYISTFNNAEFMPYFKFVMHYARKKYYRRALYCLKRLDKEILEDLELKSLHKQ